MPASLLFPAKTTVPESLGCGRIPVEPSPGISLVLRKNSNSSQVFALHPDGVDNARRRPPLRVRVRTSGLRSVHEEQSLVTQDMNRGLNEAARAVNQITEAISAVVDAAATSDAASSSTASSADQVRSIAGKMHDEYARYTIAEHRRPHPGRPARKKPVPSGR